MQLTTNLFLSTLTLAVSLGLSGCGEKAETPVETPEVTTETKEAETKEAGTKKAETKEADTKESTAEGDVIRIATEGAYPPMNFTNADGSLGGFDVDIINAMCDEMKANCEVVAQNWDGIIPGLISKKYDAIIAGMSITDERKQKVDFTDSYFSSGLILITKADSDITFKTLEDKKVGAQKGTIAASYTEENSPKAELKTYETQESVHADLVSGRLDAVVVDQVVGTDWLASDTAKGFKQVGDSVSTGNDDFGIAVFKGNTELTGKFNTALAAIKANGTYDKVSLTYFKASEAK